MPYIFGKLWHLAIIWAIRKAFQCILQGIRILLANHTRISPTSENDSYAHCRLLTFLLFSLSDFLAFVAIYIPYTYLPPLAIAHNILPGLRTCFFAISISTYLRPIVHPSQQHKTQLFLKIKIFLISSDFLGDAAFLISAGGISNTLGR